MKVSLILVIAAIAVVVFGSNLNADPSPNYPKEITNMIVADKQTQPIKLAFAKKSACWYKKEKYNHGSKICWSGIKHECNNGSWVKLGTKC